MAATLTFERLGLVSGFALLLANASVGPVQATEGYFLHGYGARSKALGGAGAADTRDATAAALNPAGLTHVGNEADLAVSFFSPWRDVTGSGPPGFTPSGEVESDNHLFAVPNLAVSYRLAPNPFADVVAFTVYGNGGMNTEYPTRGGPGVFQGGKAGVNLLQAFASVAFAKQFGNVSFGVAPIVSYQQFKATGLGAFGVTDAELDRAFGGGVRGGVEWSITNQLRLGVSGTSRIYSQPFKTYDNLFAEDGDFDTPPSLQAGIAYDLTPNITVLADYRRIWFSSVNSVGNPSTNALLGIPFGADNGPGFGWDDVDAVKFGIEWRTSPKLTLRAGYAYNTNPIDARDVQLNILAPAVVQQHFTAGAQVKLNDRWDVEVAGYYAPEETVSGYEIIGNPQHRVDISMDQFEVTLGVKYHFDATSAALK